MRTLNRLQSAKDKVIVYKAVLQALRIALFWLSWAVLSQIKR